MKIIIITIDPALGKKHSWLETYSTGRRDAFPLGNVCVFFSQVVVLAHYVRSLTDTEKTLKKPR